MNYSNYLYIAIRAAIDAGKAIMDIYTDPASDFEIERKADNSPLTKADKAAHKLIMNGRIFRMLNGLPGKLSGWLIRWTEPRSLLKRTVSLL